MEAERMKVMGSVVNAMTEFWLESDARSQRKKAAHEAMTAAGMVMFTEWMGTDTWMLAQWGQRPSVDIVTLAKVAFEPSGVHLTVMPECFSGPLRDARLEAVSRVMDAAVLCYADRLRTEGRRAEIEASLPAMREAPRPNQ